MERANEPMHVSWSKAARLYVTLYSIPWSMVKKFSHLEPSFRVDDDDKIAKRSTPFSGSSKKNTKSKVFKATPQNEREITQNRRQTTAIGKVGLRLNRQITVAIAPNSAKSVGIDIKAQRLKSTNEVLFDIMSAWGNMSPMVKVDPKNWYYESQPLDAFGQKNWNLYLSKERSMQHKSNSSTKEESTTSSPIYRTFLPIISTNSHLQPISSPLWRIEESIKSHDDKHSSTHLAPQWSKHYIQPS